MAENTTFPFTEVLATAADEQQRISGSNIFEDELSDRAARALNGNVVRDALNDIKRIYSNDYDNQYNNDSDDNDRTIVKQLGGSSSSSSPRCPVERPLGTENADHSRAVLSNGPAGPGPRAPEPQEAPHSPCVIFFREIIVTSV